jgi:hypothetical protein
MEMETVTKYKYDLIEYLSSFERDLQVNVNEYTKDNNWIEIKLTKPIKNINKIIIFPWTKYIIRLYDNDDKDVEYNEWYSNFLCNIVETKEDVLKEICSIISPDIIPYLFV